MIKLTESINDLITWLQHLPALPQALCVISFILLASTLLAYVAEFCAYFLESKEIDKIIYRQNLKDSTQTFKPARLLLYLGLFFSLISFITLNY